MKRGPGRVGVRSSVRVRVGGVFRVRVSVGVHNGHGRIMYAATMQRNGSVRVGVAYSSLTT